MTPSRIVLSALFLALAPWGVEGVQAQASALALEVHGGAAVPVRSFDTFGAAELDAAASFGAHVAYRASRRGTARVGFSQHRFGCRGVAGVLPEGCPSGDAFILTAWEVGGRLALTAESPRPWVGVAAIFGRTEADGLGPDDGRGVSDLAAGLDLGVGLDLPVGGRFRVLPAVRYGWLDTRFPGRSLLRMRWVVADLGVTVGL